MRRVQESNAVAANFLVVGGVGIGAEVGVCWDNAEAIERADETVMYYNMLHLYCNLIMTSF